MNEIKNFTIRTKHISFYIEYPKNYEWEVIMKDVDPLEEALCKVSKWYCFKLEKGARGFFHWQGYIHMKKSIDFKSLKDLFTQFGKGIRICMISPKENRPIEDQVADCIEYVFKPEGQESDIYVSNNGKLSNGIPYEMENDNYI